MSLPPVLPTTGTLGARGSVVATAVPVVGDTGAQLLAPFTDSRWCTLLCYRRSCIHVAVATPDPPAPSVPVAGATGGKLTVTSSFH